jgi:hypothetical protein
MPQVLPRSDTYRTKATSWDPRQGESAGPERSRIRFAGNRVARGNDASARYFHPRILHRAALVVGLHARWRTVIERTAFRDISFALQPGTVRIGWLLCLKVTSMNCR